MLTSRKADKSHKDRVARKVSNPDRRGPNQGKSPDKKAHTADRKISKVVTSARDKHDVASQV